MMANKNELLDLEKGFWTGDAAYFKPMPTPNAWWLSHRWRKR